MIKNCIKTTVLYIFFLILLFSLSVSITFIGTGISNYFKNCNTECITQTEKKCITCLKTEEQYFVLLIIGIYVLFSTLLVCFGLFNVCKIIMRSSEEEYELFLLNQNK